MAKFSVVARVSYETETDEVTNKINAKAQELAHKYGGTVHIEGVGMKDYLAVCECCKKDIYDSFLNAACMAGDLERYIRRFQKANLINN